jgi:hypothetical protein
LRNSYSITRLTRLEAVCRWRRPAETFMPNIGDVLKALREAGPA